MRPRRDTCANHNRGARTTRKTATPTRAERCGQVRVRVSTQVTLLEHASPLVCIVCGRGQPAERERLIANYRDRAPSRPVTSHPGAAAGRRGDSRALTRDRRPPGCAAWEVCVGARGYVQRPCQERRTCPVVRRNAVAVRRRGRDMGVGRPSRSRPRERARRAARSPRSARHRSNPARGAAAGVSVTVALK